jgi:hypothetical protein
MKGEIWIPITISFISFLVPFAVLCWTIYMDKSHLGKMRFSMFWVKVINQQGFSAEEGLYLTVTNIGK